VPFFISVAPFAIPRTSRLILTKCLVNSVTSLLLHVMLTFGYILRTIRRSSCSGLYISVTINTAQDNDVTLHAYRLFWAVCCLLSLYGSVLLVRSAYDAFQTNPLSTVVSTTYLDWSTSFPSASICETENNNRSRRLAEE